jgi:hypothetical protein
MTDKDQDETPQASEILSTDGLPIHEIEDNLDEEAEFEEEETDEAPVAGSRRRFGFGRGGDSAAQEERHQEQRVGSVRDSHERVHIDDRASAVWALICAGILIGVLALSWAGGMVPKAAVPTLPPLVVPTAQATPTPAASVAVSVAPSASVK